MKKILYTQRVEIIPAYGERRDCADQRLPSFLSACGFLPLPVPNLPEMAEEICQRIAPDGIFFTGGNNLKKYGGDAPERDDTERFLLEWAIEKNVPVFGICRGMQIIVDFFGFPIEAMEGHVKTRHAIRGTLFRDSVNSYHNFGIKNIDHPLIIMSESPDGSIEAFRHESLSIAAVGWHPEREEPFCGEDIKLIQEWFM